MLTYWHTVVHGEVVAGGMLIGRLLVAAHPVGAYRTEGRPCIGWRRYTPYCMAQRGPPVACEERCRTASQCLSFSLDLSPPTATLRDRIATNSREGCLVRPRDWHTLGHRRAHVVLKGTTFSFPSILLLLFPETEPDNPDRPHDRPPRGCTRSPNKHPTVKIAQARVALESWNLYGTLSSVL